MLYFLGDAISTLKRGRLDERSLEAGLEDILVELRAQRAILKALAKKADVTQDDANAVLSAILVDVNGDPLKWEIEAASQRVREILSGG